jgi:uncharacterized protein YkwD
MERDFVMAAPSSTEQYLLELINESRLDPLGSAARYIVSYSPLTSGDADIQSSLRYFSVNGAALLAAYQALTPAKPLAWSSTLSDAALGHNSRMIAADQQSHQVSGEASLGTRVNNAGYSGWNGVAENIFAYADSALYAHAGFMVDWGSGPNGMQSPAGHRNNIMSQTYREIGIGITAESNPATAVGPLVVTQDFGYRSAGPQVFVLGVAYNDTDGNRFYSVGEGVGTLNVASGTAQTTSAASGGYTLGLAAGPRTVSLTGAGLSGAVTVDGTFASGTNVKIDVVGGHTLRISESATIGGAVGRIEGLGLSGLNLTAGAGAQTVVGTPGGDKLAGGEGADGLLGNLGADTLIGDGAVLPTENARAIERLYLATLARGPDAAGWAGWTAQLDSGRSLNDIATGFVNSPEFIARYGPALTNEAFVTLLYQNVLHRAPDGGGLAGWTGALAGGATRESVVTGFSESAEFIRNSDPELHAAQTYRLYGATLARAPDATGLVGWADALDGGRTLEDIASGFVNAPEFTARYGSTLSNEGFVTLLYQNVLSRAPDAGGLAAWTGALAGGMSRTAVVTGFSESAEYVAATTPAFISYMRTALTAWGDTIEGGAGNDRMSGGDGPDRFVFRAGQGGSDHVYELEPWDGVQLSGFGYASADAALAHMTQQGADVVFSDQGQTITFHDTTLATLRSVDYYWA